MTRTPTAMYVHPWDIVDEGADAVFGRIASTGIKAVNLATSYHSGRYLLAHNPKRKFYFAEEGVVYFDANPEYFRKGVLKPRRSSQYKDVDVLALTTERAKKHGLKVNSWTVSLHNSAFGRAHPEIAIEDAFGGTNYNFLCPNNPEARKYNASLVRSLLDYDINTVMLEAASFPPALEHGDHHEMFGAQIEPITSELMTFCFCEHCTKAAKKQGLDLQKARKLARSMMELSLGLPGAVLKSTSFSETLRTSYVMSTDMEDFRAMQNFQRETVTQLFDEAREVIRDAKSKVRLNVITYGGFSGEYNFGRGAEGVSLPKISRIVDGIDLVVYVSDPNVAHYLVKWCGFEAGGCPMYVALRPAYPILFSREGLMASVKNSLEAGAKGVAFYNYGWTPLSHFEWIRESVEAAP